MKARAEAELWDMTHRRRENLRQLGRHRLAASNARMPQRLSRIQKQVRQQARRLTLLTMNPHAGTAPGTAPLRHI